MKMKGKRVIAGILLVGILAVTLAGCKNTGENKKETEKPVITLGSDSYPPYTYLNEDGVPTGIDVELATEAFRRMKNWWRAGRSIASWAVFPWKGALTSTAGPDRI